MVFIDGIKEIKILLNMNTIQNVEKMITIEMTLETIIENIQTERLFHLEMQVQCLLKVMIPKLSTVHSIEMKQKAEAVLQFI